MCHPAGVSINGPGLPLLLSIDFEDWHQLAGRRLGLEGWERPGPALGRQTERLLGLLDELGVKATFFILGMTARSHPELVRQVAAAGHELACHGDAHILVHRQSRREFEEDVRRARATIESLTGQTPRGYRAPAFSITTAVPWAHEVLAEQGFAYDSSWHDSPLIRGRLAAGGAPRVLALPAGTLLELPVAVWRVGRLRLPVGGASYWSLLPDTLVLRGVRAAGAFAGLYLHPYELDPRPLRLELSTASRGQRVRARLRAGQRNWARRRAPGLLALIARRHALIPYGEAHAQLSQRPAASP